MATREELGLRIGDTAMWVTANKRVTLTSTIDNKPITGDWQARIADPEAIVHVGVGEVTALTREETVFKLLFSNKDNYGIPRTHQSLHSGFSNYLDGNAKGDEGLEEELTKAGIRIQRQQIGRDETGHIIYSVIRQKAQG